MPPTTFAKSTELKPVHTYNGLPTENWTTELLTLGVIFACINFYGPLGQCFFLAPQDTEDHRFLNR